MSSSSSTFASGQSPTATQVNGWAQGTLGYAQVTTNQTGITTMVDLTGLTTTVTVVTGRRIRIVGSVYPSDTVAGDTVVMKIMEGSTELTEGGIQPDGTGANSIERSVVLQPSVGSHTYKLQLGRTAGTGTITLNASTTFPAFILVEDIGAV